MIFSAERDIMPLRRHNRTMSESDLMQSLKNLAGEKNNKYKNYKTSASNEQVLRTLAEMKMSFIKDGMNEFDADKRVGLMLEAYGIVPDEFSAYYQDNKDSLQ